MSIEIRSTFTPYAEYSTIHDVLRTRSGTPVNVLDSAYLEDQAPSAEWCLRAYTLSNADLLAEVQAKLATTDCPETQWQAWRLLYAAIRLRSGLRVPAAVIDLLIGFLKQPLSKAEDIIAGDIDDHIASQNFAISYAEDISTSDIGDHTAGQSFAVSRAEGAPAGDVDGHIKALAIRRAAVSAPAFQHNLCAKLEGQLFTILLSLCISGHKDAKTCIAKAGGLGLLQDLATANMDQHHLTNREPWLLHPETKSRIEQLNSLVPLAIFAIVEASSSEDKVQPPNIKLPDAQQNLVRDLNEQLQLLYQATLPRGQGGVDNVQGVSFGDFATEPMTVDRCEAFSAELEQVGSSLNPAANYVRSILRNWNLALGKPVAGLSKDALCWLFDKPKGSVLRHDTQKVKAPALQKRSSKQVLVAVLAMVAVVGSLAFRHHTLHIHERKVANSANGVEVPLEAQVEVEYGRGLEVDWWHERR